jgi:hypothetical protein
MKEIRCTMCEGDHIWRAVDVVTGMFALRLVRLSAVIVCE